MMLFSRFVRIRDQLLALWKWCLSFRKQEWELGDYPIRTTGQDPDPAWSAPRFIQHRHHASIINWWLAGSGDTPEQARENLEQEFENTRQMRKQEGKVPVRPGTKVPRELASQEKVSTNEALSNDFIQRILGLEWA